MVATLDAVLVIWKMALSARPKISAHSDGAFHLAASFMFPATRKHKRSANIINQHQMKRTADGRAARLKKTDSFDPPKAKRFPGTTNTCQTEMDTNYPQWIVAGRQQTWRGPGREEKPGEETHAWLYEKNESSRVPIPSFFCPHWLWPWLIARQLKFSQNWCSLNIFSATL